ncbi:FAD/NAD(P)-binding protein [Kocuria sp. M1R5S2]|uniref:FAD/NAD(P)-binding protein n=1 Tax=Kocuria rhizosphaerae TaxID=3376285 RepID=UPI0037AA2D8E
MAEHTITFVGGGPRAAMVLERLAANRGAFPVGPLRVHVVEPFEPASGRIWRYDQSPLLKLNSMAEDVTMFTDATVECDGPAWEGPSLLEWCRGVAAGTVGDARVPDADLARQVEEIEAQTFPTRRLQSVYLQWFWRRVLERLGEAAVVVHHRARAEALRRRDDGWEVVLADGAGALRTDVVVHSLGHTDTRPTTDQLGRAAVARRGGGWYASPAYTNDLDYSGIRPGQDVLVTGMGLGFVDLLALLFEGRGGSYAPVGERLDGLPRTGRTDGGPLGYTASGREPRLFVGSRRGVPYHSKITSRLRVPPPDRLTFLTRPAVDALLARHAHLDFDEHVWPMIAREAAHHWYRELFLGHPGRVTAGWEEFDAAFRAAPWGSAELSALLRRSVPDPRHVLDLRALDRPLEGLVFEDAGQIQEAVVRHVERDLALRTTPEHSETLALFTGLLRVYMEVGRLVPVHRLDDRSQRKVGRWWHGFFSFVDSGPPAHRLQELLALHRAGLVRFLGPDTEVDADPATGLFRARSRAGGPAVEASAYVEARLPAPSVVSSADPALAGLHASGAGMEQTFETEDGASVSTGKLVVDHDYRVVDRDGAAHRAVFAIGAFTSSWTAGAFARPRANSGPFRESDALARTVLAVLAQDAPDPGGAQGQVAPSGGSSPSRR